MDICLLIHLKYEIHFQKLLDIYQIGFEKVHAQRDDNFQQQQRKKKTFKNIPIMTERRNISTVFFNE